MAGSQEERFGPLNETKGQVMRRLRDEGRWDEFVVQRDQLLGAGRTGREAWTQLVPLFQPATASAPAVAMEAAVPVSESFDDEPAFDGDFDPNASLEVARDVAWAYHNFGAQVSPPPSPGAVELLKWARTNRTKFFSDLVPKVKPAGHDEEKLLRDSGRRIFDVIARFRHANGIPLPNVADGKTSLQRHPSVRCG